MHNGSAALRQALDHHKAGRLQKAASLYRSMLGRAGRDAELLHLLSIVADQQGRPDEAVTMARRAVAAQPSPQHRLQLAQMLSRQGLHAEAAQHYAFTVESEPENPNLRVAYGNALREAGDEASAVEIFIRTTALFPDCAEAWNNRGVLHDRRGETGAAIAAFRQAHRCNPRSAPGANNLGCLLLRDGHADEAETMFRHAITVDPAYADARSNLAVALEHRGDMDGALETALAAIKLKPDYIDAHRNAIKLLLKAERPADAIPFCLAMIDRQPDAAEWYGNLGFALGECGRRPEALVALRQALLIDPDHVPSLFAIIPILNGVDRHDDALATCCKLIELKPDDAAAHCAFGMALQETGRWDDAIMMCGKAIELAPHDPSMTHALARIAHAAGSLDTGIEMYDRALVLGPGRPQPRWDRAFALMLAGRWEEGWAAFETRWEISQLRADERCFTQPRWQGEDLAGRTLLIHAEQGQGDTLQFARFVSLIAGAGFGGPIVFQVQRNLLPVLGGLPGVTVIGYGDPLPAFDVYLPLMSLPGLLQTRPETVPPNPTLPLPDALVARWQARMASEPGLKIGLVWAGSPLHRNDRNRSVALARLLPLLQRPGITWFSLQVGAAEADLAQLPPGLVTNLAPELDDFASTAAAMRALDLVITVDTSCAHLAGMLGVPVWTLLPFCADWRWLQTRPHNTPWYPSMRLFRQPRFGDWDSVVGDVNQALTNARMSNATSGVPVPPLGMT